MEPKWLPTCAKFRYESQKVIFYLEQQSLMDFDDFKGILPPKREPKLDKKWFQNGNRFKRPLESGFYEILMNFGTQNGTPNLLKRYLKTGPKKDAQRMRLGASLGRLLGAFGRREALEARGGRKAQPSSK